MHRSSQVLDDSTRKYVVDDTWYGKVGIPSHLSGAKVGPAWISVSRVCTVRVDSTAPGLSADLDHRGCQDEH